MTLAELEQNIQTHITGFTEEGEAFGRLHRMGVIPGATVTVLRTAPLGDPIQVRVEGTLLSIRKRDARQIQVESV